MTPPAPEVVPSPVPAPTAENDAIYFVLVDRFANGDPTNDAGIDLDDPQGWHGGDLRGVIDHLDHIEGMGFRSVWLSPIHRGRDAKFKEWGAYHGYWVHDLEGVHPRFGDEDTLRELSVALEQRGMRLIVDMVYNHTGFDAPRRTTHPHWYHDTPGIENWDDENERITHQVHGLPDLAQEHPEVYAYMREQTTRWVREFGVDGLRIDAVRHMPPAAFARLHQDLEQDLGRPIQTIAEIFEGDVQALDSMWTAGAFTQAFNFPLHHALRETICEGAHPGRIASTLDLTLTKRPTGWVNFIDNHDVGRLASACQTDAHRKQALTTLLLAPGTPMITYGTESGLTGSKEPENRGDMRFGDVPYADHIRDVLRLRTAHPALMSGDRTTHSLSESHWVDLRWTTAETAAIIANFSASPQVIQLPWEHGSIPFGEATWSEHGLLIPAHTTAVAIAPAPLSPPSTAPVTITFAGPEGGRGTPVLVGASPQLGSWDPHQAPTWTAGLLQVTAPAGTTLAFKVAWKQADGSVHWETGPNRFVQVTPQDDLIALSSRAIAKE